jgi:protein ImuA
LGDRRMDGRFPGGRGLPLFAWHEIGGEGLEIETAAAPAAFAASLAAPLARRGAAVWVMRRADVFAPGLIGLGFPAERLIQVLAGDDAEALGVAEEALAAPGVAAVFVEADAVDLVAGRRLQLACERGRGTGFLIRRRPFGGQAKAAAASPATRWRVACAPSAPQAGEPGLGAPRWKVELERCRGGRPGSWIVEAPDAFTGGYKDGAHPLRVVAELADRQLAPPQPLLRRVA